MTALVLAGAWCAGIFLAYCLGAINPPDNDYGDES
jgi:hypothetical protein